MTRFNVWSTCRGRGANERDFRLFAVDASTGEVLSSPVQPAIEFADDGTIIGGFNFGGGLHPLEDGSAVGVTWNGALSREEIHAIDLGTMHHEFIAAIPGVLWTGGHFGDPFSGRVYVHGGNDDGGRVVGIDAATGVVLSDPAMPVLEFDDETGETTDGFNFGGGFHVMHDGTAVGVTWNGLLRREEIRGVDLMTMNHQLIAVLPGVEWTGGQAADPFAKRVYVPSQRSGWRGSTVARHRRRNGSRLVEPGAPDIGVRRRNGRDCGRFQLRGWIARHGAGRVPRVIARRPTSTHGEAGSTLASRAPRSS